MEGKIIKRKSIILSWVWIFFICGRNNIIFKFKSSLPKYDFIFTFLKITTFTHIIYR